MLERGNYPAGSRFVEVLMDHRVSGTMGQTANLAENLSVEPSLDQLSLAPCYRGYRAADNRIAPVLK